MFVVPSEYASFPAVYVLGPKIIFDINFCENH